MNIDDAYRLLDVDPRASDEEIRRAHRDLTKVWHPDRFAHDAELRRKAEEKLKAINEAWETIRSSRGRSSSRGFASDSSRPEQEESGTWRVRWRGREARVGGPAEIAALLDRGHIGEKAEAFDPAAGRWIPITDIPELRGSIRRRAIHRNRRRAFACAVFAIFILLRRPTPAGLAIALFLLFLAFLFLRRMRIASR